jgi:hypothetical protein
MVVEEKIKFKEWKRIEIKSHYRLHTSRVKLGPVKKDIKHPWFTMGDLFSIDIFKKCVDNRGFMDYDGHGYLATMNGYDKSKVVFPSEFNRINTGGYTHVAWFNK